MTSDSSTISLHEDALVIDSHNDTIVSHIRRGNISISDEARSHHSSHSGTVAYLRGPLDVASRQSEIQINLPKMR